MKKKEWLSMVYIGWMFTVMLTLPFLLILTSDGTLAIRIMGFSLSDYFDSNSNLNMMFMVLYFLVWMPLVTKYLISVDMANWFNIYVKKRKENEKERAVLRAKNKIKKSDKMMAIMILGIAYFIIIFATLYAFVTYDIAVVRGMLFGAMVSTAFIGWHYLLIWMYGDIRKNKKYYKFYKIVQEKNIEIKDYNHFVYLWSRFKSKR